MATPVQMPKQGNSVEECLLVEWCVEENATVSEGDILCNIETDKASFEVPAPASGTVLTQFFGAGELVPVLTNITVIGDPGEETAEFKPDVEGGGPASGPGEGAAPTPAPAAAPAPAGPAGPAAAAASVDAPASPRARKLAASTGINLATVPGTGPNGRITSRDVQAAADARGPMTPAARAAALATGQVAGAGTGVGGHVRVQDLQAAPAVGAAPAAAVAADLTTPPTEVPYRGIRKIIGDRMLSSLMNHAQMTMNLSADATSLMAHRKTFKATGQALGLPNITIGDMVAYVVTQVLAKTPELNAIFERSSETLLQYHQVHLAVAVDTPRGLMVPVIANAHALNLAQLSMQIADYAGQCRQGAINPDLLQGGTFTITNLGALGIQSFTPVLNSPQVAILGVCGIEQKPVPDSKGGYRFQPTMGLSLTIDHQVVDGAPAARFLKAVAAGIADFSTLTAES